ncbi:uncharacterized protein MELLADRAFT_86614 [Melampsora larici-populina 98AG31]|uniref:Uncharacterized protein n=1 Tax=Melampsora larici-populina (strain 98AG31 / pathotype 3-4-7) TaxID=747676 RepID=F4RMF5_MELLP|nr:uncharacterized protein MELLADRAFT_86614 [Melampsora larici-populina 98AG31]EGG06420.1 hypothetical protein MELLADRAFT_86614 [Melampsora larici-populina 98AG31]
MAQSLPLPPPAPEATLEPELQMCSVSDPIKASKALEALVNQLKNTFHDHFYQIWPKKSEFGPWNYFPIELAWEVAKNIDIINKPEDLRRIFASEILDGQFLRLFATLTEWKGQAASEKSIVEAATRRKSARRTVTKPPMSVEGAELAKLKDIAEKEANKQAKLAEKESRERQKIKDAEAKTLKKQREAVEKARVAEIKKLAREARLCAQAEQKAKKAMSKKRPGSDHIHTSPIKKAIIASGEIPKENLKSTSKITQANDYHQKDHFTLHQENPLHPLNLHKHTSFPSESGTINPRLSQL